MLPEHYRANIVLNARRRRGGKIMRNAMLAMAALISAALATLAGSAPVVARDYPYCIQGGGWGVPGDCSYRSYAECMASASGRRVYCNVNPRFAFDRQQRRARTYREY
jgi:hypothetical protein